jgi:anti-sigma-K factor RskA
MSEEQGLPTTPTDGRCGDAAIYLLGLLDEHQAARFLGHAEQCAICRDELGALQPAVDVLPETVPQLVAPAHVKRQVMSVVRAEASQEPLAARAARPRRAGAWGRLWPRADTRRAALAFAVAGLIAGGIVIGSRSSGGSAATPRVISADVTIAGASAVLHESAGHSWLTVAGLPQPRRGRVYEVWVKRHGGPPQPTSSLFTPTTAGRATAAVPDDLGRASEVMVTQEPAGGSALPTSTPIIVARVS